MTCLGPWQFSLKSLMIGVTVAILALPLLPLLLLLSLAHPDWLFFDFVTRFLNRQPRPNPIDAPD